ncbi:hypothetical protein F383_11734 [Gossypium arboreum]|uniref:Uncharacterized protein n=1 Tax=Gossypium arboreum TaxID=29729 RepID=A0A0B0PZR4_GOSAR|nr:hypothetical protein F383_11734 [Gossypium arboreum]
MSELDSHYQTNLLKYSEFKYFEYGMYKDLVFLLYVILI